MMGRIDSYKSDLSKLNERLKYTDMENGMLLRYRDEIQLMEKEYDLIIAENDKLQKTISQLKKTPDKEDKFKKNKCDSQYQIDRKTPTTNIPYLNTGKAFSQKYSTLDDLVSLSLSERSFDQF
jgi:hypothetical protein